MAENSKKHQLFQKTKNQIIQKVIREFQKAKEETTENLEFLIDSPSYLTKENLKKLHKNCKNKDIKNKPDLDLKKRKVLNTQTIKNQFFCKKDLLTTKENKILNTEILKEIDGFKAENPKIIVGKRSEKEKIIANLKKCVFSPKNIKNTDSIVFNKKQMKIEKAKRNFSKTNEHHIEDPQIEIKAHS